MLSPAAKPRWMRFIAPLVWLAVLQVFVASLMACSPDLHDCFHSDAHESSHHCLSTDLQAGTIEQPVVIPVVAPEFSPVAIGYVATPTEVRHLLPIHLCGSLLEHGPPVFA